MRMDEIKCDRQSFPCHLGRNLRIGDWLFGVHCRDVGKSTPTYLPSSYVKDLSGILYSNEVKGTIDSYFPYWRKSEYRNGNTISNAINYYLK